MKNYKTIWDDLSTTFAGARFVVGYLGEEDDIRSNGQYTADFLQSVLQIQPTDKVLEIGCGIARIGRELAPRCGEWHGSDISGNMIAYAAERTKELPNVYLHELPEPDLSIFNDGYFDCVYSTIVFMHLDKVEMFNYIREAYRVLAPGGRVYFDTYNVAGPEGWVEFMKIVEAFPAGQRPGHVSQFSTPPEMHKFMVEAGYSDIHIDDINPALVLALGKKPEQEGFDRPSAAINPDAESRIKAMQEGRLVQEAHATASGGLRIIDGNAVLDYERWLELSEHIAEKDAYIAKLEAALTGKDRHINALEARIRKQDKMMRTLPVRAALRLSKRR